MPSKVEMERSINEMVTLPMKGAVTKTTGKTFYVSSVTGAAANSGHNPGNAKATINQAYDLCTASKGDVIYVMEGHAESLADATTLVMDCIGVSVIGLGHGSSRPEITYSNASGNVPISVADNTIRNIYFSSDESAIASQVTISGTNTLIEDCEFNEDLANAHIVESIIVGVANNDANNSTIRNCKFYNPNVDHNHDIYVVKDQVGLTIEGNWCQGTYAVGLNSGAISSDSAENMTNLMVKDNVVFSASADQGVGINFPGTNTGLLIGNYAAAPDSNWTPFIAAGCGFVENFGAGALASSGYLYPLVDS